MFTMIFHFVRWTVRNATRICMAGSLFATLISPSLGHSQSLLRRADTPTERSQPDNPVKVLYRFQGGGDGGEAWAGLTLHGHYFGTTAYGGAFGAGVVYQLKHPKKSGWTDQVLYTFTGGSDGAYPFASVTFYKGNMYGTTAAGGTYGCGTVFELLHSKLGWGHQTVLYSFTCGSDGSSPQAEVVFDKAGNLYGTTVEGGTGCDGNGCGTVFELTPSNGGWRQTVLHAFEGGNDGRLLFGGLILDDAGNVYGATQNGGGTPCPNDGCGIVFELSPSNGAWTETVLYRFAGGDDGGQPQSRLTLDSAGSLYGTAPSGGTYDDGVVFRLTPTLPNGPWVETTLFSFGATDRDGLSPQGGLTIGHNGKLWGTTFSGGIGCPGDGCGVVFTLKP